VNFFHATVKTRRRWDGRALWAHLSAKVVPSTVTSVSSAHLIFTPNLPGPRISVPSQPLGHPLTSSLSSLLQLSHRGPAGEGGRGSKEEGAAPITNRSFLSSPPPPAPATPAASLRWRTPTRTPSRDTPRPCTGELSSRHHALVGSPARCKLS
jgi:hypothetical protein